MMKYKLIAVLALVISLILAGCGKQAADVPKNGLIGLVSEGPFTVGTWQGTLSEDGNAVTIEATQEQSELFQSDKGYKLVVYSEKQDGFLKNVTVIDVTQKPDESGYTVKIDFGSEQKIDAEDSLEALLMKHNTISIPQTFIQVDDKGKYVWKVQNDMRASVNQSGTSEKKPVKLEKPKKVYIETGLSNENAAEVISGLAIGDIIARPEE